VKIKRALYEVPAELHLHPKLPNDWRVEAIEYDGECHIYNQGLYIATLAETKKPSRSSAENAENPEIIGHHIQRQKTLQAILAVSAQVGLLPIPDEAESILDATRSPDYWTKITEKQLDNALSEKLSENTTESTSQKRKKMFNADDVLDKPLEIIKIA
jgi:hypothetical protein